MNDGRSGFRLNDGPGVKLHSVGWCLMLGPPWLNLRFSLAWTIFESWVLFFVSSQRVDLIRLFLCDDTLQ